MSKYNPRKIEKEWQEIWVKNRKLSEADEKSKKPRFYCLDMFPYPSGEGLHVGHVESYTASDIVSRYQRMNGKNVLHPIGWDAFGLPAENYAIKTGMHPAKSTQKNIQNFTKQIKSLGLSYDWSREIDTSSPEYYKWTQWFFLFLHKHGLAYRKKAKVNWCESCKTVLANEQVEDGVCERCKNEVVQKDLEQWFFRITDFAEDLIKDLDKIDWPESTKTAQKNWIGKSEGANVKFPIAANGGSTSIVEVEPPSHLEAFTTRLDTIYGCTYCVVAPEHNMISNLKSQISNLKEVEKYISKARKKTDRQRTDLAKEKTGVELKGVKAINPFTNEAVPIYVADYVLSTYGTGAVMAVPAHDERDFEFAKKYKLPIGEVIEPVFTTTSGLDKVRPKESIIERDAITSIVKHWKKDEYIVLKWKQVDWKTFITGGPENGQSMEEAAITETLEETGYKDLKLIRELPRYHSLFYHVPKKLNRFAHMRVFCFELKSGKREDISEIDKEKHEVAWVPKKDVEKFLTPEAHKYIWRRLQGKETVYADDGIVANSGKYSGLSSEKAREEMAKWLEKKNLGGKKTTYKLRDWLISRQRYWGAPIPVVYCENCARNFSKVQPFPPPHRRIPQGQTLKNFANIDGKEYAIIPVPEKDLPVILPKVKDYRPKGTSPLGTNLSFVNTTCPKCKGKAKRETDTMDTFVCSSWYYLRYADPKNKKEFAGKTQIKKWLPVDLYIGGAEHTVLHLLYSRFFTKALFRHKYINFNEPFQKLRHQGIILGEDHFKMSKSRGNVTNPDDLVRQYGADTLRLYEMFMGPLEDMKAWNTKSIVGLKRFLDRVWKIHFKVQSSKFKVAVQNSKLENLIHKTIKKVTEDIENLRFNTAISAMMVLVNEMEKENQIPNTSYQILATILSPFAPHIAEELWSQLGHKKSIFLEKWPKYDPKLAEEKEINIVVQVNGKVRDQIKAPANIGERETRDVALELEKIKKYIPNRDDIKKIIFVPGRLINFVI